MFKKILSAIVILLISIPIFSIGGELLNVFVYIICSLGLNEFINLKSSRKKLPLFIKLLSFISLAFLIFSNISGETMILSIDYRVLSGIFALFLIPTILYHDRSLYSVSDAFYMIGGILFLGISFSLILVIRNYNFYMLIYLFLIGVFTDTYAFITGNLIGKRKLLESVSPFKTIEGMIGGVLFGTFVPVMYYYTVISSVVNVWVLVFITLFLSILGCIGDLCFSNIKRYFGKKDYSNLIPGHGGILDRFDSILFILLGFMFFINIIGG